MLSKGTVALLLVEICGLLAFGTSKSPSVSYQRFIKPKPMKLAAVATRWAQDLLLPEAVNQMMPPHLLIYKPLTGFGNEEGDGAVEEI